MGHNIHRVIVVTGYFDYGETIHVARDKAVKIFKKHFKKVIPSGEKAGEQIVTPVFESPLNRYGTFFIIPSGSKIGWEDWEAEESAKNEFVKWLRETNSYDWAYVTYMNEFDFLSMETEQIDFGCDTYLESHNCKFK